MNKRFAIGIVVAVIIGVGFLVNNLTADLSENEVQVATSTDTVSTATSNQSNSAGVGDPPVIRWKVGERVGNLKVVSIAPHNPSFTFDGFNVDVTFTGKEPVEGTVEESEMLGPVLNITKGSLPCGNNPDLSNSRCNVVMIDNSKELGFDGLSPTDSVQIKAVVTKYIYTSYPAGGAPNVTLAEVVRK